VAFSAAGFRNSAPLNYNTRKPFSEVPPGFRMAGTAIETVSVARRIGLLFGKPSSTMTHVPQVLSRDAPG
jgi:hypothetical protein